MQGFSLLEALISMALLAMLLLGLDAMELSASRINRETYFFAVAANQLQVMEAELLLLPNQQAFQSLITAWNRENQVVLPQGRGMFDHSILTIYWGETTQQKGCEKTTEGSSGCLSKKISLQE
jgi:Tfp pilus assembly protein PilV